MARRTVLTTLLAAAATLNAQATDAPARTGAGRRSARRPVSSIVDVREFGAVGDGRTDDTHAIQAAIDHAVRERLQAVHLPPGLYRTTDTIHLGYGDTFTSVSLVGDATFAFAGMLPGATLKPERADRPAVNIQGGRGNVIRNISILGRNVGHLEAMSAEQSRIADPDPAHWLDPALGDGLRRFGPYAAITIDAFSGSPQANGYERPAIPTPRDADPGRPRAFSSDILIERCWLGGFGVAIAVQPCDADGNGDFVKVAASQISHCVYGIAIGNSQSRNVSVQDCNYVLVHTFLTNKPFGRGVGQFGGPVTNLSGGGSFQLFDMVASMTGPLTISQYYVEGLHRIGVWSNISSFNNTLIFQSCNFSFGESMLGASPGALLECGILGAVHFVGCSFSQVRRAWHLVSGASHVRIDSCMFAPVTDFLEPGFYRTIPLPIARALNYLCGGVFLHADALSGPCALDGGTTGLVFDIATGKAESASRSSIVVASPGRRIVAHHYARQFCDRFGHVWTIRARPRAAPMSAAPGKGALLAISRAAPDAIVARFLPSLERSLSAPLLVGDLVYHSGSAALFVVADIRRDPDSTTIRMLQMNAFPSASVASSRDPMSSPGTFWHYPANVMLGDTVYFGDFLAGSATISNVHRGDGSAEGLEHNLLPGDVLHFAVSGPPMPAGDRPQPYGPSTAVVATDAAARTVTLDRPALATARHTLSPLSLTG